MAKAKRISIPRALAGPDNLIHVFIVRCVISIPRALAGPDTSVENNYNNYIISIPRALAGPDKCAIFSTSIPLYISIPRALAGPDDGKQLFPAGGRVFQSPGPSQAPTST